MSYKHILTGAALVLAALFLSAGISSAQVYDLKNDVLDDGGIKLTSAGYIGRGSFGQPTIGKISSADYIAIIGFWHPPYAPPTGVEEDLLVSGPVPLVFNLSQNYPNPFSRSTTIPYSVQGSRGAEEQGRGGLSTYQRIILSVYDLSGRVVCTLVDEEQEPGYYSVTWDLRGVSEKRLPNGVYFYRLKACPALQSRGLQDRGKHGRVAEAFIRTRKMIVLR